MNVDRLFLRGDAIDVAARQLGTTIVRPGALARRHSIKPKTVAWHAATIDALTSGGQSRRLPMPLEKIANCCTPLLP